MKRPFIQLDLLMIVALVLLGALARAPYLALIPVLEDEAGQTVHALSIQPGEYMPLVGVDPYAGPLFSYIIAICLRLFGSTPAAPRIVVMVMGALTVGLTYLLARAFGLGRLWAALVGLLMAANLHHILINSHYAGTTYILPFFSTAFFSALVWAVKRESGGWLVAAGALLGLAMQTNPIPALMLPGVAVWFLMQRQRAISLRTRWPYLAAIAFLIAYAPVIAYNLQTGVVGIQEAGARSYLWQPSPSLFAALGGRLAGAHHALGEQSLWDDRHHALYQSTDAADFCGDGRVGSGWMQVGAQPNASSRHG
jgi:4-amino-4-deoxy-L-arabinose transferase-like glycosyltransferase